LGQFLKKYFLVPKHVADKKLGGNMKTIKVTKISKKALEALTELGYSVTIVGWGKEPAKVLNQPLRLIK